MAHERLQSNEVEAEACTVTPGLPENLPELHVEELDHAEVHREGHHLPLGVGEEDVPVEHHLGRQKGGR